MPMPRTPIEVLKLEGNVSNLKRALKRAPKPDLAKREQLEEMFEDIWQRRKECLADVKKNGYVIRVEKSNARSEIYESFIPNPAIKILQTCERQLVLIAKALTGQAESKEEAPEVKKDSFADFVGDDVEPANTIAPN